MTNSVKDWMKAHKVKTFWLGLLLLFCCVELYDGTPHRFWLTRQLRTQFFVEVTVQLEVAGEPLTLTRDIRCMNQWHINLMRDTSWSLSGQVFDALGGVTKTGRTFVTNIEDVCAPFWGELRPSPQQAPAEVKRVYEPIGTEEKPDEIKAYMFEFAKTNQIADVKLVSATMTKKQRFKLFDHEQYDNWMRGGWYNSGRGTPYSSYYFYEIDPRILTMEEPLKPLTTNCSQPCVIELLAPDDYYVRQRIYKGDMVRGIYGVSYHDGVFSFSPETPSLLHLRIIKKSAYTRKIGFPTRRHFQFMSNTDTVLGGRDFYYLSPTGRLFTENNIVGITVRK